MTRSDVPAAAEAIRDGHLVIYPTETVYGLGADALDPDAVQRVFEAKRRHRDDPISMAVPDVDSVWTYTQPTDRERTFVRRFLPGPVTVVLDGCEMVPDVLTGGRERVGVRVPDHDLAVLLLDAVAPVTATSANRSGATSARTLAEVQESVRDAAAATIDGGQTPGGGSTVVDVERDEIHRRGRLADEVEAWLADN